MQIKSITEDLVTHEIEGQIADLLARAFDVDFGGRSFYDQRHHMRFVAYSPDIVGHVALQLRAIRQGEQVITIAGLAEVATDPQRQGEGIATMLVKAAIDHARATVAPFVLLFGDEAMYERIGFRSARNPITFLASSHSNGTSVCTEKPDSLMVMELGAQRWDHTRPIDLLGCKF